MLDANAFILLLAGHPALVALAAECAEGELAISAIAFAEVAHGSASGKAPSPAALEHTKEMIPVLPFDAKAAAAYANLPFRRGSFDRLIAAHALATGLILVTANLGDFVDLPGLQVENWTRP
ncbi:MAG: type II toxin-antitoxin system VapC family toxin [Allosphingosinicella sp.]|uniref:type II toxin-antitoxin system VapC family toxin n=1 Tax=Allosphingosinicella sp. TaxID=2823234 RepID=UPI003935DBCE